MSKNYFKFSLSYAKQPLIERIFDADCYNQSVRYGVRLQDWAKQIRNELVSNLCKNTKDLTFNLNEYQLNDTLKKIISTNKNLTKKYSDYYSTNKPKLSKDNVVYHLTKLNTNENISGFSYTLYINNNIVIEREFSVENFNVESLFSVELINYINNLVNKIKERIKNNDNNQMWDDFDIIKEYNLTSKEVRELSEEDRKSKLYFIKKKYNSLMKFIESTENIVTEIEEV
jgi:hypothetical protein